MSSLSFGDFIDVKGGGGTPGQEMSVVGVQNNLPRLDSSISLHAICRDRLT